ncbi:MAG TPA: hypothetical protein VJT83_02610, partial [Chitinophagaceae bacterium]|nr:hypothetical protein [Chitinophagaceae bacterium]
MKTNIYARSRLLLFLFFSLTIHFSFSQQVPKSVVAANGTFIGFLQYTPTDYSSNPNTKYPLIIFLHGIGERGNGTTELGRVAANAIPRYINAGSPMRFYHNGEWKTFLVISPQLANGMGYWPPFYVEEMIKYAKQNLQIDTNRIYLTGLSLGGGGVWQYATESVANSKQLAAIAPVCGTCNWSNMCNIAQANLPVWAFHASDDTQVGYGCTTGAISMLNSCGPTVAPLMTIYPNGNHYIWDRSYDTTHNWHNPNIYEWFLSNVRNSVPGPPNVPPIANAGPDQTISLPVTLATLNASASSDPDGTISAFYWTKISGPSQYSITLPNSAISTVTNLVQGTYQFAVSVTDNRGSTSKDTVTITVNQGLNMSPVAIANGNATMILPLNAGPMDANASYDPDGGIASIQWTKVSGPSQYVITSPNTSFTYVNSMVAGTYKFQLRVVDFFGAIGYDTVTMTVSSVPVPPNVPPVARAGADQTITLPANSVTLNGSASSDADGMINSYAWSKIAGPATYNIANSNSVSTSINNLVQGTYLFRLVV